MAGDSAEGGYGLVGSAPQNGQRLILVVAGLKTAAERAEESRKLLEWGFRSFEPRLLVPARRNDRNGVGLRRRAERSPSGLRSAG